MAMSKHFTSFTIPNAQNSAAADLAAMQAFADKTVAFFMEQVRLVCWKYSRHVYRRK